MATGLMMLASFSAALVAGKPAPLWPTPPPALAQPEKVSPGDHPVGGRPIEIVSNVSVPRLTFYPARVATAAAPVMVVFPGGGYYILARDLEGTEACEWARSLGMAAVLVEYRVPRRPGRLPWEAPLEDAQRAISLIRAHAADLRIDPNRIGVLGFSAGGNLAALASCRSARRSYAPLDAADTVSCRPDFCLLIYPAYLVGDPAGDRVGEEFTLGDRNTPPTFIAMAEDDPTGPQNATRYWQALHAAGVPAELHLYPTGGHGYGLRPTADAVTTWPARAAAWLQAVLR